MQGKIKIGYDKWLHFLVGMMIFLFCWLAFNIQVGLTVCVLTGVFKELSDVSGLTNFIIKDNKREFNFWDMVATMIVPIIIYMIVNP